MSAAENGVDGTARKAPLHSGENAADAVMGAAGEHHQPRRSIHHADLLLREGIQHQAAIRPLHDRGGMHRLLWSGDGEIPQEIHMRADLHRVVRQAAETSQALLEEPRGFHRRAYQLQGLGIGLLLGRVAPVVPPFPDEKAGVGVNGNFRRQDRRQGQQAAAVVAVVVAEGRSRDLPEVDAQLLRVPQAGTPLPSVEQQAGVPLLQIDGQAEFRLKAGVQGGVFR